MASAVATTHKPLIDVAVPASGAARWAVWVVLAIAGSLILWASAKVQVPFYPVPMTLQTLAIMVIAAAYGWRLGLATILLYLAEGAFGLPVFSGTPERGIGLAYMLGPTAGYLAGFIVEVVIVGWFAERGAVRSPLALFPVMLVAAALVLALGFAYLSTLIGVEAAWNGGVVPFLLGDLVKVAVASLLIPAAARLVRK
ncbi:MAG: biotin transporter BioY [Cucumibacter sp.]